MCTCASGCRTPHGPSGRGADRKSTRLNSSHGYNSHAVFCLKKKLEKLHVAQLFPEEGEPDAPAHEVDAEYGTNDSFNNKGLRSDSTLFYHDIILFSTIVHQ